MEKQIIIDELLEFLKKNRKYPTIEGVSKLEISNKGNVKVRPTVGEWIIIIKSDLSGELYNKLLTITPLGRSMIGTNPKVKTLIDQNSAKIINELQKVVPSYYEISIWLYQSKKTCKLEISYCNKRFECGNLIYADLTDGEDTLENIVDSLKQILVKYLDKHEEEFRAIHHDLFVEDIQKTNNRKLNNNIRKALSEIDNTHKFSIRQNMVIVEDDNFTLIQKIKDEHYKYVKPIIVEIYKKDGSLTYSYLNKESVKKYIDETSKRIATEIYYGKFEIRKFEKNKDIIEYENSINTKYDSIPSVFVGLIGVVDCEKPYRYLSDKMIYIPSKYGVIKYKGGNKDFTLYDEFKKLNNTENNKFKDCVEFLKSELKKIGYNVSYYKGVGLLYGDTRVILEKEDLMESVHHIFELPNYENSIVEWKNAIREEVTKMCKAVNKQRLTQINSLFAKKQSILGKFISRDIVEFVKENEDYITANAVAQFLRGNSVQLNTYIKSTNARGRYEFYSIDDIKDFIDDLVHEKILTEKQIDGTYGTFYILKIGPNVKMVNLVNKKSFGDIKVKIENNGLFNDDDAFIYFENIKEQEFEIKDYINLLNLTNSRGFISMYENEYFPIFKNASKEFFELVKMKRKMSEDNMEKKIYKKILDQQIK